MKAICRKCSRSILPTKQSRGPFSPGSRRWPPGNCEIGQKPISNPKSGNLKLNTHKRGASSQGRPAEILQFNLKFRDFGFEMARSPNLHRPRLQLKHQLQRELDLTRLTVGRVNSSDASIGRNAGSWN